jgi:hypothetical protein
MIGQFFKLLIQSICGLLHYFCFKTLSFQGLNWFWKSWRFNDTSLSRFLPRIRITVKRWPVANFYNWSRVLGCSNALAHPIYVYRSPTVKSQSLCLLSSGAPRLFLLVVEVVQIKFHCSLRLFIDKVDKPGWNKSYGHDDLFFLFTLFTDPFRPITSHTLPFSLYWHWIALRVLHLYRDFESSFSDWNLTRPIPVLRRCCGVARF